MFPRTNELLRLAGILTLLLLAACYICITGSYGIAGLGAMLALVGVTIQYGSSLQGGGASLQSTVSRTGDAAITMETTLTNAQGGSLTTRTDDDTGTITMTSGSHTIATGNVVDVYWSGGVQYGVTVGTVSGTSVPIDLGTGDALPAQDTAVTVVVQTSANLYIDGDNTKILGVVLTTVDTSLRTAGHVQFRDSSNAEIHELDLVANVPQIWDIEGGSANPFTGNPITNLKVSQGNATTTETYTLKIIGAYDSTP